MRARGSSVPPLNLNLRFGFYLDLPFLDLYLRLSSYPNLLYPNLFFY